MTYRYLTGLADVCRAAGLKVVEVDGWKTRGRPASTGGFNPVGVLCHHTATSKASSDSAVVSLLVRGRSDLPGPLCQLGLARDGTVYVIAAGRANHAGSAKASGTVAAGDGNSLYIGIEAFNDGRGEPWPAAQYDAYVKLCAALCVKVTGNSAATVRGHKETSVTGKIDPTFSMDDFRKRVAAEMAEKPQPKPTPIPVPADEERGARITTANIQSVPLMPPEKVRDDVAKVAYHSGIIGWQEIQPAYYKAAVGDLEGFTHHHLNDTAIPVSLRSKVWTGEEFTKDEYAAIRDALKDKFGDDIGARGIKVSGGHVQTHGGEAKVSPNRDITFVKATNRSGKRIVVLNTHLVSGAHDGGEADLGDAWRARMWDQHSEVLEVVLRAIRRLGYTVVGMGDFNRRNPPKFLRAQKWIDRDGIDHIWWIPAKDDTRVDEVFGVTDIKLNSDHRAEVAEIRLES